MTGSLGEAVLDLAADDSGLMKGIDKAKPKALNALGKLGQAGGMLLSAGIAVAAAAVIGLTTLIWNSANTLDGAYDRIQTQTGATGERLEALKADFQEVFKSVPTDAETAADAISLVNQRLGLTGPALQDTTKTLLEMTRITGGDLQTNAEAFTRLVGDWGVPLENSSLAMDKVFVASQQTGIGVDRLMQLMVQFGAPMRQFGFSFEQSAAMLAKWEKEGVNTELVMGSLRIAAGEFARKNIPLQEGLLQTFDAIKNAKDESSALSLAMEVFGARAGPDMAAAIRENRFELGDLVDILDGAGDAIMTTAAATMDWGERLQMFRNRVTTAFAPAGEKLMDVASKVLDSIAEVFERPDIQAAIMTITTWVGDLADKIALYVPIVIDNFFKFVDFLKNNEGVVIAILAAIGVAIAAFVYTTVIPAAISVITALAPVIAIMAVVAAVAYLLYQAWTNNWGGIQQKVQAVWAFLQPIFQAIVQWFQAKIPAAIQAVSQFWNTVLLPAIRAVWGFVSANILPLLAALGRVLVAVVGVAVKALAGYWQNILMPRLKAFQAFINGSVMPIITKLATWLGSKLKPAFDGISKVVQSVIKWLDKLTSTLNSIQLPDALTPGSPTPFEIGLWGINRALRSLAGVSLPTIAAQMQVTSAGFAATTGYPSPGAQMTGAGVTFYAPVTFEVRDGETFDGLMRRLRQ